MPYRQHKPVSATWGTIKSSRWQVCNLFARKNRGLGLSGSRRPSSRGTHGAQVCRHKGDGAARAQVRSQCTMEKAKHLHACAVHRRTSPRMGSTQSMPQAEQFRRMGRPSRLFTSMDVTQCEAHSLPCAVNDCTLCVHKSGRSNAWPQEMSYSAAATQLPQQFPHSSAQITSTPGAAQPWG